MNFLRNGKITFAQKNIWQGFLFLNKVADLRLYDSA